RERPCAQPVCPRPRHPGWAARLGWRIIAIMRRGILRLLLAAGPAIALAQTPCERLSTLAFPNTKITAAEARAASATLPAHCRVAALLTPTADSHIEIEVWLPAIDWNGKFQAVGNGGWAGSLSLDAMGAALREHYATASTD